MLHGGKMPLYIHWTQEEEDVLTAEYPWRNLSDLASDLNKTMYGIKNKAKKLKLIRYPLNLKRTMRAKYEAKND